LFSKKFVWQNVAISWVKSHGTVGYSKRNSDNQEALMQEPHWSIEEHNHKENEVAVKVALIFLRHFEH
jgi:hypothetical protein